MTSKKCLLFVCTTPFQLSYVNIIVGLHFSSKNFYKILYSSILLDKEFYNNFDEVFIADKTTPINKLVVTYRAIKRVRSISRDTEVRSFFSHTGGLVANFCYQELVLRKGFNFSLFYEGILSFYEGKEKKKKKHIFRKFVSFFYGFNYTYRELLVPLESVFLCNIFTPFPELTLGETKKKCRVSFDNKVIGSGYDNNLIIGSLIRNSGDRKAWSLTIRDIKNRMGLHKVLVKRHPDDKTNYLISLINQEGIDVEEITSIQPVEFLIQKHEIRRVFSMQISSALFNLHAIYGEGISLYYKKDNNRHLCCVYIAASKLGMKAL